MTQEAAVPGQYLDQVRRIAREEVAAAFRAAPLRNATISDGGLTLKGGFLRLIHKTFNLLYVGPTGSLLGDGSYQQVIRLRRADGTMALQIHDAFPGVDGTLNQAMTWWDRSGNIVLADDTDSGQGVARPYVPGVFYKSRHTDWPVATGDTFQTVYRARMPKQHPRLFVRAWGVNNTADEAGEIRVMVNGVQLGAVAATVSGTVTEYLFGPEHVGGAHMATLVVEIQARVASGTGGVQVGAGLVQGQQS